MSSPMFAQSQLPTAGKRRGAETPGGQASEATADPYDPSGHMKPQKHGLWKASQKWQILYVYVCILCHTMVETCWHIFSISILLLGQPFKWRWAHHPSTSRHPSLFPSWQVAVRSNRGRRTSSWWKDVLHKRSRSEIQGHGSTLPQLFWPVLAQCLNRFKSSTSLSFLTQSDTFSIFFHLFPYTVIPCNTNASIILIHPIPGSQGPNGSDRVSGSGLEAHLKAPEALGQVPLAADAGRLIGKRMDGLTQQTVRDLSNTHN